MSGTSDEKRKKIKEDKNKNSMNCPELDANMSLQKLKRLVIQILSQERWMISKQRNLVPFWRKVIKEIFQIDHDIIEDRDIDKMEKCNYTSNPIIMKDFCWFWSNIKRIEKFLRKETSIRSKKI